MYSANTGSSTAVAEKWPFQRPASLNGIDEKTLRDELNRVMHTIQIPATIAFEKWSIDFLTDYIVNVHHSYLWTGLPESERYFARIRGRTQWKIQLSPGPGKYFYQTV